MTDHLSTIRQALAEAAILANEAGEQLTPEVVAKLERRAGD